MLNGNRIARKNFIYALSCMVIPCDNADEEFITVPCKWETFSMNIVFWGMKKKITATSKIIHAKNDLIFIRNSI